MDNDDFPIDSNVSVSLHPHVFLNIEGLDDDSRQFVAPAIEAFETAVLSIGAIHKARDLASKNAALTPENVILQVSAFADKKVAEVSKLIDRASATLKKQVAFMDNALQEPLEQSTASPMSAEIRSLVRGMTPGDRRAFIKTATDAGDTQALSAVLGAPIYLTGITALERDAFTRIYREKASPALANRLKVARAALAILDDNSGLVLTQAEKAIGADRRKVTLLREADNKMRKAFSA